MSKFDSEIDRLKSNIEANHGAIERISSHLKNGVTTEEKLLKRLIATNEDYSRIIENYRRLSES